MAGHAWQFLANIRRGLGRPKRGSYSSPRFALTFNLLSSLTYLVPAHRAPSNFHTNCSDLHHSIHTLLSYKAPVARAFNRLSLIVFHVKTLQRPYPFQHSRHKYAGGVYQFTHMRREVQPCMGSAEEERGELKKAGRCRESIGSELQARLYGEWISWMRTCSLRPSFSNAKLDAS